jgi:hypothetical protein
MRSMLVLAVLAAVATARPAAAGPGWLIDYQCGTTIRVVGGEPARRFVDPRIPGLTPGADDDARAAGCHDPEGCYIQALRILPAGAVENGQRYLALVTPAGGAECTSTAVALAAIPLAPFDAAAALLGVG